MDSVNQRLMDFQVAQQIKWIRFQNREVREALAILRRVDSQLAEALRNADPTSARFTDARLRALRIQVSELLSEAHRRVGQKVIEGVNSSAVTSAEVEYSRLRQVMPAGLDVTTPNLGVLQTVAQMRPFNGAGLDEWIGQLRDNDLRRSWNHILDGITSGTTTDEIIRGLNGTQALRYKDGVREVTRRGTEALVRTSINHATNTGRQMVWEANDDLIAGVRWVATLDSRTSPICQHRDGRVGPVTLDDPNWKPPEGAEPLDPPLARPPAHPNCRSTTVAVLKSWRDLGFDVDELPPGTRASMDGQVPSDMTYFQWLQRQPDAVQKDVLGATRWDLWKNQGVTPDRFFNDAGRQLTIDQLRRELPPDVRFLGRGETFDLVGFSTTIRGVPRQFTREGARADYQVVFADVRKLDDAWKASPDYVGIRSAIGTRRQDFRKWLDDNPGEKIQMSHVGGIEQRLLRDAQGRPIPKPGGGFETRMVPGFADGRHRFSVLRDEGVRQMPVLVHRDAVADFRRNFSAPPPATQVTRTPPTSFRLADKNGGFGSWQFERFSVGFIDNPLPVWRDLNLYDALGKKRFSAAWDRAFRLMELDVAKLVTIQGQLDKVPPVVGNFRDLPPIKVAKLNGSYIVLDGNHRAAALWVQGERSILANVIDLDDPKNASLLNRAKLENLTPPPLPKP